jgi:hypothetical protein
MMSLTGCRSPNTQELSVIRVNDGVGHTTRTLFNALLLVQDPSHETNCFILSILYLHLPVKNWFAGYNLLQESII